MARLELRLAPLLLVLLATGCGGGAETGPRELRWDRDACARCSMVVSDRSHAAQVRWRDERARSRVAVFDDIGCALVWLGGGAAATDPRPEIWVLDARGAWLDARTAWYETGARSPMDYQLAARAEPGPALIDFDEARAHVARIESRQDRKGAFGQ